MKKKVTFASSVSVRPMIAWCFAHRSARRGPWMFFVLDTARFNNRIRQTGIIRDPVLDPIHRNKIYKKRFKHCIFRSI